MLDWYSWLMRWKTRSEPERSTSTSIFGYCALNNLATYILDTPLRRLTKLDRLELESEQGRLRTEIAELTSILDNEDKLRDLTGSELAGQLDLRELLHNILGKPLLLWVAERFAAD